MDLCSLFGNMGVEVDLDKQCFMGGIWLAFSGANVPTMKKYLITLSRDHVSPAGLLFSFLLGVFTALLYFAICL